MQLDLAKHPQIYKEAHSHANIPGCWPAYWPDNAFLTIKQLLIIQDLRDYSSLYQNLISWLSESIITENTWSALSIAQSLFCLNSNKTLLRQLHQFCWKLSHEQQWSSTLGTLGGHKWTTAVQMVGVTSAQLHTWRRAPKFKHNHLACLTFIIN